MKKDEKSHNICVLGVLPARTEILLRLYGGVQPTAVQEGRDKRKKKQPLRGYRGKSRNGWVLLNELELN